MAATKVTLRKKLMSNGRLSLYLDFFPPIVKNGKTTRREFLNLSIVGDIVTRTERYTDTHGKQQNRYLPELDKVGKPKRRRLTPIELADNHNTMVIAEGIRLKRANELNKAEIYHALELEQIRIKENGEQSFSDFFTALARKKQGTAWQAAVIYLNRFNTSVKFNDLTEQFCSDFAEYLKAANRLNSKTLKLNINSAQSYFSKFKAALRQAHKNGNLQVDINAKIKPIKTRGSLRGYLLQDELDTLAGASCKDETIKRAALFSALTGMAFADIAALTWSELTRGELGPEILFHRQKTATPNALPINEQARVLMGEQGEPGQRVFDGLQYSTKVNRVIRDWMKAAGIDKQITFHMFRHTFATLQLSNGTDIYTVSSLLSHKSVKTTQIYTHVLNESKHKAVNRSQLNQKVKTQS